MCFNHFTYYTCLHVFARVCTSACSDDAATQMQLHEVLTNQMTLGHIPCENASSTERDLIISHLHT